jgi:hypothetical protein
VRAFPIAFDSITKLIIPLTDVQSRKGNLTTSFVATHAALLMQAPVDEFVSRANVFLANLQNEISQVRRNGHCMPPVLPWTADETAMGGISQVGYSRGRILGNISRLENSIFIIN